MKRLPIILASLLTAATPAAAMAQEGPFAGQAERQAAKFKDKPAFTASTRWRNVPRLDLTRCTLNQVTVTVGGTVSGGPAEFRVLIDTVIEAPLRPRRARFVPDGAESFSYSFIGNTLPFHGDDTHRFNVQWRSPTGARLTLRRATINLLFQRGTQGCP
jgi:hypothetical protein